MKTITLLTASALVFGLASCKKDDTPTAPQTVFEGSDVNVGSSGAARTIIETDASSGRVKSVSISFDKRALEHLPTDDGHGGGHTHHFSYKLPLPAQKSGTPYDHIVLNWNPQGHPPQHVYDKPHFDVHFYGVAESERLRIPAYGLDSTGFLQFPAAGYLPATYIPIPGGEAEMGKHWADRTAPELNPTSGQSFTQTFIYGTYAGAVNFWEPMITLDFLKKTKDFTRDIPQPEKFAKDGYYPTKMSVVDKGETVELILHAFVQRQKS